MKINSMKSALLSLALLTSINILGDIDVNKIVSTLTDLKDQADQASAQFDGTKAKLLDAQTKLKDSNLSPKEKAIIATTALVAAIGLIYKVLTTMQSVDNALVDANVTGFSDVIKSKVKPQIDKVLNIAKQVNGATKLLNDLVK